MDDYEPPYPGYNPLDQEWKKNPRFEEPDEPVVTSETFYDDLGKEIVKAYSKKRGRLEKVLEGLSKAHKYHVEIGQDVHPTVAQLLTMNGIGELQGVISNIQGRLNKNVKIKSRRAVPFYDQRGGPQVIQFIQDGILKAMHRKRQGNH